MKVRHVRETMAAMLLIALAAGTGAARAEGSLRLTDGGRTGHRIVIAADASPQAKAAAGEFALHFKKITGADIRIVTDAGPLGDREILIGPSGHLAKIAPGMDVDSLVDQEYWIRTVAEHLVIVGGPRRGVLHGVWALLEEDFGCRWYTPTFAVIPKKPDLHVPAIDRRHVPAFECRAVWAHNAEQVDAAWAARMHLNSFVRHMRNWKEYFHHPLLDGSSYYAEHSSHTFPRLVSTGHYDEHPEYFSLVDGQRVRKGGQLCMSNPDVAKIAAEWANSRLDQEPKAQLVSISPDDLGNFCECGNCARARDRYPETKQNGCGQAAVLVPLVNEIARRVEAKHPRAIVTTLAYQWTRLPAAELPVHDNVAIRYCPIEICALHAIDDPQCPWNMQRKNDQGTRFIDELATWTKIAPRVWVWYYAYDRPGSLQPGFFLGTASDNFRLFERLGVKGVQAQGHADARGPWRPLQHLKSYIFAKLTWDPQYDVPRGVREFCRAYYGPAGDEIEAYAWALHDAETYEPTAKGYLKDQPGLHAGCGVTPTPIRRERLAAFDAAFDRAEGKVAGAPDRLRRVLPLCPRDGRSAGS